MTVAGFLNASAAVLRFAQEAGGSPRRRLQRFVSARRALHLYDWQGSSDRGQPPLCPSSEADVGRMLSDATAMDAQFLVDLLSAGERGRDIPPQG